MAITQWRTMHIHDLHATILHILGIDHERLTYPYGGRNFRLTDVAGSVAHKILWPKHSSEFGDNRH